MHFLFEKVRLGGGGFTKLFLAISKCSENLFGLVGRSLFSSVRHTTDHLLYSETLQCLMKYLMLDHSIHVFPPNIEWNVMRLMKYLIEFHSFSRSKNETFFSTNVSLQSWHSPSCRYYLSLHKSIILGCLTTKRLAQQMDKLVVRSL